MGISNERRDECESCQHEIQSAKIKHDFNEWKIWFLIILTEFNECSVVTVSNSSKKRISFRKQQRFLCCDEFDLSHDRSQI